MAVAYYFMVSDSDDSDSENSEDDTPDTYFRGLKKFFTESTNPFQLPEPEFMKIFGFPPTLMHKLCRMLDPYLEIAWRRVRTPSYIRVLAAMCFFASGAFQHVIAHQVFNHLSQPLICRSINEVSDAITQHLDDDWMKFPAQDEYSTNKESFLTKFNIPDVIGVLGNTHITINHPGRELQHKYVNSKNVYTKNVMIVCDLNCKILAIDAKNGGATSNSDVWMSSAIRTELHRRYSDGDHCSWLLGSSSYNLEPFLMTPVNNASDGTPRSRYNMAHEEARSCLQRCVGMLKSRFKCILDDKVLKYSPARAETIIHACAMLHNIAISHQLPVDEDLVQAQSLAPNIQADDNNDDLWATVLRMKIIGDHFQ